MHCSLLKDKVAWPGPETFFRLCRVVDLGMKAEVDISDGYGFVRLFFCFSVVTACSHSGTEITTLCNSLASGEDLARATELAL